MQRFVPLLAAAGGAAAVALAFLVVPLLRPAPPRAASVWATARPAASGLPQSGSERSPAPSPLVYVAGSVARPGVYAVRATDRVRDAVAKAGGLRGDADATAVNLAAHLRDGDEIVVPARGEETAQPRRGRRARAAGSTAGSRGTRSRSGGLRRPAGRGRGRSRRPVPPAEPIDINRAGAEELATLPGVGPGLAARIVTFREVNGPFASPDELLDVGGITERRFEELLPYVVVR